MSNNLWLELDWHDPNALLKLLASGASPNTDLVGETPLMLAAELGPNSVGPIRLLLKQGAAIDARTPDGFSALLFAVQRGATRIVRELLKQGADVESQSADGLTALHFACSNQHDSIVKVLLDNAAPVNARSMIGRTPLMDAARTGDAKIVKLLIACGADVHAQDTKGCTAILSAVISEQGSVVATLAAAGADLNAVDNRGRSALGFAFDRQALALSQQLQKLGAKCTDTDLLVEAIAKEDLQTAKELLAVGANPNAFAAVHRALEQENIELLKVLIGSGAALEQENDDGLTALMVACRSDAIGIAQRLLDGGADINATTAHDPESLFLDGGQTALMIAVMQTPELVAFLLDNGAKIELEAADGNTALTIAISDGEKGTIELLLDRGADINQAAGFTPLYNAIARGDDIAQMLIERGADVNQPIWTGTTPLIEAAKCTHLKLVMLLLDRNADVNHADREGETPLHAAVNSNDPSLAAEIVGALLAHGADMCVTNNTKTSPLHTASHKGLSEIVTLLLNAGADLDAVDTSKATALHHATRMNRFEVVESLLVHGAALDLRDDSEQYTAIMHAAANGYVDVLNLLVEAGADRNAKTPDGKSLIQLARQLDRTEMVAYLSGEVTPRWKLLASERSHFERANKLAQDGQHASALESYLQISECSRETSPPVASNLGYCYQQLADHENAVAMFARVQQLQPDNQQVWRTSCFSLSVLERWQEMLTCADRAIELKCDDDYAWQQRSIALAELERFAEAIEAGREALQLQPGNGYAAYALGQSLRRVGECDEAIQRFAQAFESAPELRATAREDDDLAELRNRNDFRAILVESGHPE